MQTYKTILTNKGLALSASSDTSGKPLALSHMAIGDGGGNATTPDPAQTSLVREVYRDVISNITPNPNVPGQFTAEVNVPSSVGGFTIREACILTTDGDLFAVCNTPATYKSTLSEGSFGDGTVKMVFQLANAATVNLSIDTSIVMATRQWVVNNITSAAILPGGLTHQMLSKKSNADGDVVWVDPSAAVQVIVDTIEETQTLAANQLLVNLTKVTTSALAVYVNGTRLMASEWAETTATQFSLTKTYAAGTKVTAVQNEQTGQTDVLRRANNLSDVANPATSLANLGGVAKTGGAMAGALALFGGDTGVTPPQFDRDTSLATTEFVQNVGEHYAGVFPFQANTALNSTHVGSFVYAYGNTALTFAMPAAAGLQAGVCLTILNASSFPLSLSAPTNTHFNFGQTQLDTVILQSGDSITFTLVGSSWFAAGGNGMDQYSTSFYRGTGYQKLPSGFIIQWGIQPTNTGGDTVVTLPLAFPNGPVSLSVTASIVSSVGYANYWNFLKTSFNMNSWSNAGTRLATQNAWIAIGY
jgi:hypothetical protein